MGFNVSFKWAFKKTSDILWLDPIKSTLKVIMDV